MVELAMNHNGDDLVKRAALKGIQRPDDITEVLSYWKYRNSMKCLGDKAITKQLKLGLAERFADFDEYHLAKYKGERKEMTLKDALFLLHVKPKNKEQKKLFKTLIEGELKNTETWESGVKFEKLILEEKLPYMATLRNLRNIIKENVSKDALVKVSNYLQNEKAVTNSKQLPFRFFSAYNVLKNEGVNNSHIFFKAIENAMKVSANNITGFNKNENILICSDVSGSMGHPMSKNTDITMKDVGLVFASTLNSFGNFVDVGVFGSDWIPVKKLTGQVMQDVSILNHEGRNAGGSTIGYKCIKWANNNKKKYDKIVFFTDCEIYADNYNDSLPGEWQKYLKENPSCKLILFNLAGYGTTPVRVNDKNVIMISGWSDKIFDVLNSVLEGDSIVEKIEAEEI